LESALTEEVLGFLHAIFQRFDLELASFDKLVHIELTIAKCFVFGLRCYRSSFAKIEAAPAIRRRVLLSAFTLQTIGSWSGSVGRGFVWSHAGYESERVSHYDASFEVEVVL